MTGPGEVTVCATSLIVAARVRELRRERGWSHVRLAAEAGLSRCMMSFLENGRRNWTLPMLERVAGALETSPAALLAAGDDDGDGPRCGTAVASAFPGQA